MKRISMFAAGFIFAAIFSVTASAQTATPAAPRIVVIDTTAFGAQQGGITKYVNALTSLENEFKPAQNELNTMATRIETLQKEIEALRQQAATGKVPIDQNAAAKKVEELEKTQREAKFKQEDATARFERRRAEVLAPITQDIGKAIGEYSQQKGYDIVVDLSRDEAAIFLWVNQAKTDITKEFITFYNARPAGAATAAAPRQ